MLRITTICLLAALQVVTSEPPMQCKLPFQGDAKPTDCCDVPMIFKEEDFTECGIDKTMEKPGAPDCSTHKCLFKKNNLIKDDDKVDREATTAYLDKWVESNPGFKEVIDNIKTKCLQDDLPGPADICEPTKVIFCSLGSIFLYCPTWKDSENCNKLKEYIMECKPHYS